MLEQRGYRREEIRKLSRCYVLRVLLGHPRGDDGELKPQAKADEPAPSEDELFYRRLARFKYPDYLIERRTRQLRRGH